MIYHIGADLVVVCHFLFILFVIFGGLLLLISKKFIFLHIPATLWGASLELFGWICPLTPLENTLRMHGSRSRYAGGFIEHYLVPIIYPAGLTRDIQILLGAAVLVINVAIYIFVFRTTSGKNKTR